MIRLQKVWLLGCICILAIACNIPRGDDEASQDAILSIDRDKHRPYFHFTPDSMWMNDPNGMVFYEGIYHLFYQYYPDSTIWGPMHWGHATSPNLVDWSHKPIALYPDELGYIFSGSAVLDDRNTSGLGAANKPPLVAIFTHHDPLKAKAKQIDVETQSIAYSNDSGETWTKYDQNPVLENPAIRDFRDPKVRWHEHTNQWIMTLAAQDHIRFYSSSDLKQWSYESEFGNDLGAHGGVWECPDLFPLKLDDEDKQYWILIVNLNPGGPNGGSGVQYFIGEFDGQNFSPIDEQTRWLDYGPDDYAGVTWSNTGDRTLFIGWMSNWKYANIVPTKRWRSAMTIARELDLLRIDEFMVVSSMPVDEFSQRLNPIFQKTDFEVIGDFDISETSGISTTAFELDLRLANVGNFSIVLFNEQGNEVVLRYDDGKGQFSIDRSNSGDTSFHPEFGTIASAPRARDTSNMDIKLVVDVASLEVFADDGTTVMTSIFFPNEIIDRVKIIADSKLSISSLQLSKVNPVSIK